jgi:hypothetical protein
MNDKKFLQLFAIALTIFALIAFIAFLSGYRHHGATCIIFSIGAFIASGWGESEKP